MSSSLYGPLSSEKSCTRNWRGCSNTSSISRSIFRRRSSRMRSLLPLRWRENGKSRKLSTQMQTPTWEPRTMVTRWRSKGCFLCACHLVDVHEGMTESVGSGLAFENAWERYLFARVRSDQLLCKINTTDFILCLMTPSRMRPLPLISAASNDCFDESWERVVSGLRRVRLMLCLLRLRVPRRSYRDLGSWVTPCLPYRKSVHNFTSNAFLREIK